jgi:hypothetical protein
VNAPPVQQGPLRRDLVAAGAAALICVLLYFAIASENIQAYRHGAATARHYNSLVDGFLSGHLYMGTEGGPGALGDTSHASLYKGRYYLYFGAAPAAVLFLPWKVLTGADLAQYWAAAVLVSAGYLGSLALLARIKRSHFPGISPALLFLGALVLGIVNWWPLLLSRVGVWEVPIAGAYCFAALSVLCIHEAAEDGRRTRWLAAASLLFGLAVASRPNYVLGSAVLALPLLRLWWAERASPAESGLWIRRMCAAALPIAAVGALVASYNYLRFDSPFEFGTRYMTTPDPVPAKGFSITYAWTNLYMYLLAPAHFSPWFPFFKLSQIPVLPEGYAAGPEDMYGALANMPVLAFAALGVGLARFRRTVSGLNLAAGAASLLFAAVASVLMLYYGANNRYEVDVMCGVPVLTVLGVWAAESRGGPRRTVARALWGVLAAYSAFFAFCASVQRDEIFRSLHPGAYRAIAHVFDAPADWYDRLRGVEYGPLSLNVRFPAGKMGRNEPVVVTGWGPWSNVLYVRYDDAEHVQFGFVGASGTAQSAPLRVDYSRAHTLMVSMGSFYPPRESPFFDKIGRQDAETLADTLFVSVDGVTVLRQRVRFFDAVSRRPEIGRGPPMLGSGWAFTGSIGGG